MSLDIDGKRIETKEDEIETQRHPASGKRGGSAVIPNNDRILL